MKLLFFQFNWIIFLIKKIFNSFLKNNLDFFLTIFKDPKIEQI